MAEFEKAMEAKVFFEAEHKAASEALRAIPGVGAGSMGLTPDEVKVSPGYRAARRRYENAHAKLRAFNQWFMDSGHGERYRKERRR